MVERSSEAPTEPEFAGPNPLVAGLHRWPLLVLGLVVGGVLGVLLYIATPPTYQSGAQLLVLKKRTDVVQGGDVRVGVLEDHVATQLTLIKSEKIRMSAVKKLRNDSLNRPLPADDLEAAQALMAGLNVSRDKESSSPGQIGSGIVVLSYRGPDPSDTKTILKAVIEAYQGELAAVYEAATVERVKVIDDALKANRDELMRVSADRQKKRDELRGITTEDVGSIRSRITSQKDKQSFLELELIDLNEQIALIEKAGTNLQNRKAVLTQLTAQLRSNVSTATDAPEVMVRMLEAKKKELAEEYGKDHPEMKKLESQLLFYKEEIRRQNPDDATGKLDDLSAYEQAKRRMKRVVELQVNQLKTQLSKDEQALKDGGRFQDQIDALTAQMLRSESEITRLDSERRTTQVTQGSGGYTAQPITPPGEGAKVSPVLFQSLLLGLAVGLLLGAGAVGVAELTDKSFRSPTEIRRRLGLPIVGFVPQIRLNVPVDPAAPKGLDPSLVSAVRPKSAEAESFRGVRTQLYFSTQGRGNQVIQVTSPSPGDGKSTLAGNLAISIAQSGKRVVLIDADFRKPRIHKMFGLASGEAGLAGVIDGVALLPHAIRPSGVTNLDILPCGPRPTNPAELLTSPRFQELLGELKASYSFVVIDTPPMLAVSDPAAVAPRVDGVLMVFRMTKNVRPAAERAREQLGALGANVLGVIVNGWSGRSRDYGDYNYGAGGYKYTDYRYADDYAEPESEK